jgi:hypothetical protein
MQPSTESCEDLAALVYARLQIKERFTSERGWGPLQVKNAKSEVGGYFSRARGGAFTDGSKKIFKKKSWNMSA